MVSIEPVLKTLKTVRKQTISPASNRLLFAKATTKSLKTEFVDASMVLNKTNFREVAKISMNVV